jgi:glycosyltransferase involved in cell wall biosynthesis
LFISSFAEDEPTLEIIDAIRHSKIKDLTAYITGNYSKLGNDTIQNIPENIILTGYLPDNDYIDLLFQVDIVIVLTKMDYTLLCGCYEAIAAEKPLITSNTNALKNYFKNAFFVENDPNSILNGISTVYNNMKYYENSTIKFKNHLIFEWNNNFHNLKKIISSI